MRKIYIILFLTAIFCADSWAQNGKTGKNDNTVSSNLRKVSIIEGATKEAADSAYKKDDFETAAQMYESLLAIEGESPVYYYNLGNCFYKLDNIPQAIICYERAFLLDPGDADIRANLALARGKTVDKVTPPSEMFFVTWARSVVNCMSIDKWAVVAIASFILMLLLFLAYLFTSAIWMRKTGFYGAVVMCVVCVVANLAAYSQHRTLTNRDYAIVIAPSIVVKSSPNESSTELFVIHEGSKVHVEDASMKGWREIKLEEGKIGWVPVDAIEVI
ncbi:MAG: tetratricopeptide repeat protein [Bacteroidaceae bacterium]|nr:tetratricopeptide repeat protein [Bacteroidaceae bacterium]